MTDRISGDNATASTAPVARPILLAWFDFEPTDVRCWSGVGTLTWDSQSWLGTGTLGEVSAVEETTEVRATGASFRLSGVPSDLISSAMSTATSGLQGRWAKLWLGFMSETWTLIADPVLIFAGLMDTIEIVDGGQTATITMLAENRLRDLERPRTRRYTDEDQQSEHPGDIGFKYVFDIQEATIDWGVVV